MTPSLTLLTEAAREALLLTISLSLPVIAVAALVSVLVAIIQTMTQMQDVGWAQLPRFLAVAVALSALGPWMGRQIAHFAMRVFGGV
jgi:type III secretory pathway component EscS